MDGDLGAHSLHGFIENVYDLARGLVEPGVESGFIDLDEITTRRHQVPALPVNDRHQVSDNTFLVLVTALQHCRSEESERARERSFERSRRALPRVAEFFHDSKPIGRSDFVHDVLQKIRVIKVRTELAWNLAGLKAGQVAVKAHDEVMAAHLTVPNDIHSGPFLIENSEIDGIVIEFAQIETTKL